MFQDIAPQVMHNEFRKQEPKPTDFTIVIKGETELMKMEEDCVTLPTIQEVQENLLTEKVQTEDFLYLFSIDDKAFFWLKNDLVKETSGEYSFAPKFGVRGKNPEWVAFGAAVGFHLATWYEQNRFCGCCGKPFQKSGHERALVCPECGNTQYPKVSPAMIVGILHEGKILLSRYSGGYYRKHALIAGYTEIGETMEETVKREVMEETGLKVKNIRYFGSQPWPFTSTLLMGFFADLDGEPELKLDENELADAEWFDREHLPKEDNTLSLTWTMIEYFRTHPELG